MSLGENRKIAIVSLTIFVVSIISVLVVLGSEFLSSGESLKVDILEVISHHEEENKYRDIIRNSEDPIFAIETDGTISYLSPGVENKLGYEPGELTGKLFFQLIHEKDTSLLIKGFTELFQNKKSVSLEGPYRIMTKNGDVRYILLSATPLMGEEEEVTRIIGSFRDITDSIKEFKDEKQENVDSGPKIRDIENNPTETKDRLLTNYSS